MTNTQAQILELYQKLPADEQRELAEQLARQTLRGDFYDRMTPAQKLELAAAIAEADRGNMISAQDLKTYMATRFNIAAE
jgi:hypothetical protein